MQTREQVKEVIAALVSSGWLLARHVAEATDDVMQKLQEMEEEKPAIVRAWERMEVAEEQIDRINAVMAFNKAYDKLLPDVKAVWAERKQKLIKKWLTE